MARKKNRQEKKQSTKRQKIRAATHTSSQIQAGTYKVEEKTLEAIKKGASSPKAKSTSPQDLFDYDPKLLVGDIMKTVILSFVFFGLEIGLYYYFN